MFQVIGPKCQQQDDGNCPATKPASTEQQAFDNFFGLAISRKLTARQGAATIGAKMLRTDAAKLLDWNACEAISAEVDEGEFGDADGIKKVRQSLMPAARAALAENGAMGGGTCRH